VSLGAAPSVAQVICVRDEEEFLADNLRYHHALGVTRAYVVLDRCTDRSPEIAKSLPWVRAIERDRSDDEEYLPHYLANSITSVFEIAREEGFDWLLAVDADEFASGESLAVGNAWRSAGLRHGFDSDPARCGNLPRMLSRIAEATEVVSMETVEIVPQRLRSGEGFRKNHFIQLRKRPSAIRRRMPDMPGGERQLRRCWFGHDQGKTLARTSADLRLHTTHEWKRTSGPDAERRDVVRIERAGFHYHFNISGADQWLQKYRRMAEYPDHWPSGKKVRFPKQAWKLAAEHLSTDEARSYYRTWIAASPWELGRALALGRVAWDPYVDRVLAHIDDSEPLPERPSVGVQA
jgi:hypothetical protein